MGRNPIAAAVLVSISIIAGNAHGQCEYDFEFYDLDFSERYSVFGISREGLVAGWYSEFVSNRAYYADLDGLVTLPPISPFNESRAQDINDAEVVAGSMWNNTERQACVWIDDEPILLPILKGGNQSYAESVNELGQVVGTSLDVNFLKTASAFLWTLEGGMVDLNPVVGFKKTIGLGIGEDGTIVGKYSDSEVISSLSPGFAYANEGTCLLPEAPKDAWFDYVDIADRDKIVGTLFFDHKTGKGPLPWRYALGGDIEYLQLPSGAISGKAISVNSAGLITGEVEYSDGERSGVLWVGDEFYLVDDFLPDLGDGEFRGSCWINDEDEIIVRIKDFDGLGTVPAMLTPLTPGPADLNSDCSVDVDDLLILLKQWGEVRGRADIDGSGTVDVNDLLLVLASWGA